MKLIYSILFIISVAISCRNQLTFPEGGYSYPENISKVDTNHMFLNVPLFKNSGDSFYSSYYGRYWKKAYGEPNLSLRPLGEPLFRLIYYTAFGEEVIISLKSNEIVVKQLKDGSPYPTVDTSRLTQKEKFQYAFLSDRFKNLFNTPRDKWSIKTDSIMKRYPEMQTPKYFEYLLEKAKEPDNTLFKYETTIIAITESTYLQLVDKINKSGYWSLPAEIKCKNDYADGDAISLEANTPAQYKYVSISNCYEEAKEFSRVCQEIINRAGLEKKISVVRE